LVFLGQGKLLKMKKKKKKEEKAGPEMKTLRKWRFKE
jgi:hypothetical protein